MAYKIWTNKVDNDYDFTEAKVRDLEPLMGLNLTGGVSLSEKWPKITMDVISDYEPADSFLCGPMLIVSKKLSSVLFEFALKDEIEYLPVDVAFNGKLQREYGFLNVLLFCDALDRNKSKFTELNGNIDSIDRICLDESLAKNKLIFFLDAIEWVICVNELLVECIENGAFSGVALKSPSEWRPF
ncbi:imm11 family protein [Undibacterium pigrum]|uniref:Immunity MXAN-0049 protein domain-containing protein n=1 Tax=Undibacterium pigrum TaxID=401470 RepID=A0A318IJJ3_9BURK|nr:DUF1629 domain-containing protein [Undibacterium pigrum]PXX34943.1 hypothetical protein DFR42_12422 [Undibacterium pigrum]